MKRATLALAIALTLPTSVWASEYPRPVQTQDQAINSTIDVGPVGSGNVTDTNQKTTTTVTSTYQEAAQTAYSTGGVIGKCLAAGGGGFQNRNFGITFGMNKARKRCEGEALAVLLMGTGDAEDRRMGRSILHTYYRDWKTAYKPKGPNRVCKTEDSCYDIEAVELGSPES